MYKIILPNGLRSNQRDVVTFLDNMNMNKDNYQIGITKVRYHGIHWERGCCVFDFIII
ncbi:hypothetical protein DPMN_107941 [Dreissena polymorpha]|uniref:Uncharacterized protein n=1 Tax=Dreissena polymorpha TaxID=45954 RepID=A0A9D4K855_DREPO|nr:hypothetical protein DPMN_107941 [Dreissena polymorpha]